MQTKAYSTAYSRARDNQEAGEKLLGYSARMTENSEVLPPGLVPRNAQVFTDTASLGSSRLSAQVAERTEPLERARYGDRVLVAPIFFSRIDYISVQRPSKWTISGWILAG